MKKKLLVLLMVLSFIGLAGCTQSVKYGISWKGLDVIPENPVVNESVRIIVQADESVSDQMMRIFHWVITEDGVQREFKTASNALPPLVFTTPGKKGVLVWVEVYNSNDYKGHEFYSEIEIGNVQ